MYNKNPRGIDFMEKENIDSFVKGCAELAPEFPNIPTPSALYDTLCSNERGITFDDVRQKVFDLFVVLNEKAKERKLWKGPNLVLTESSTSEPITPTLKVEKSAETPQEEEQQPLSPKTSDSTPTETKIVSKKVERDPQEEARENKKAIDDLREKELERINGYLIKYRTTEETRIRRDCQQLKTELQQDVDQERRVALEKVRVEIEKKRKEMVQKMELELENQEQKLKDQFMQKLEKKLGKQYEKQISALTSENDNLRIQLAHAVQGSSVGKDMQLETMKNEKEALQIKVSEREQQVKKLEEQIGYLQSRLERANNLLAGEGDEAFPEEEPFELEEAPVVHNAPVQKTTSLKDLLDDHDESDEEETLEMPIIKSHTSVIFSDGDLLLETPTFKKK
jgi:DNA repair exonuclease SbcCD ATPase subunit